MAMPILGSPTALLVSPTVDFLTNLTQVLYHNRHEKIPTGPEVILPGQYVAIVSTLGTHNDGRDQLSEHAQ